MKNREYYNIRKGFIKKEIALSFEMAKKAFILVYTKFERDGYFQKYFGINCSDGRMEGDLGNDISTTIFLKAGTNNLWPIIDNINNYTEADIYTIIEILHDYSSKPTESSYHSWNECGIHVSKSDDIQGQKDFRTELNPILKRYKNVELSEDGEILQLIDEGFDPLFKATIPTNDVENVKNRITNAILKFRRVVSTIDERRDALRDLADVLEYLKPKIQTVFMNKDTNELFLIANTFGIRHHNVRQKSDYDKGIWHSWIFYCYLATVHVCLRLIDKNENK